MPFPPRGRGPAFPGIQRAAAGPRGKTPLAPQRSVVAAVLLALGVFALDLLLPLGVAAGMLYACPVLLVLAVADRRRITAVAALCLALTVVGGLLAPAHGAAWTTVVNRAVSVGLIAATALTVLLYRRTAGALAQEQHLAQTLLDTASIAVVAVDAEGRVTLANTRACELLGVARADLLGTDWAERWVDPSDRQAVRAVIQQLTASDPEAAVRTDTAVVARTGSGRVISWTYAALRDASGRPSGALGSGQDITRRSEAEEALWESRKALMNFKYALDQSAIVAITDAAGRITYVNDYFCRISGYSREELLGQTHRLINSGLHDAAFWQEFWQTIRAGQVWKGEIRNRAKDGSIYWVDSTIVPFLDQDGRPWQFLAVRADITERKRHEQTLREQGALVRLGEMAAVVAHEVKNPLAGIAGAIQVIGNRLPAASPDRPVIAEILARIRALNATVEDLLIFARPRSPKLGPMPLLPLLNGSAALLARDPQGAGIRLVLPAEDVMLAGDPELLKPVVFNLLLNAAQAMGGSGTIRVTTRRSAAQCSVAIADEGPGIAPELRDRVFEPFFTTKHRGTGLGLAIARRVVEAHGGEVRLDCPPGGGTIVTLSLPLHRGPAGAAVGAAPASPGVKAPAAAPAPTRTGEAGESSTRIA